MIDNTIRVNDSAMLEYTLQSGEKINVWLSLEGRLGVDGAFSLNISSPKGTLIVFPRADNKISVTTPRALEMENKAIQQTLENRK